MQTTGGASTSGPKLEFEVPLTEPVSDRMHARCRLSVTVHTEGSELAILLTKRSCQTHRPSQVRRHQLSGGRGSSSHCSCKACFDVLQSKPHPHSRCVPCTCTTWVTKKQDCATSPPWAPPRPHGLARCRLRLWLLQHHGERATPRSFVEDRSPA